MDGQSRASLFSTDRAWLLLLVALVLPLRVYLLWNTRRPPATASPSFATLTCSTASPGNGSSSRSTGSGLSRRRLARRQAVATCANLYDHRESMQLAARARQPRRLADDGDRDVPARPANSGSADRFWGTLLFQYLPGSGHHLSDALRGPVPPVRRIGPGSWSAAFRHAASSTSRSAALYRLRLSDPTRRPAHPWSRSASSGSAISPSPAACNLGDLDRQPGTDDRCVRAGRFHLRAHHREDHDQAESRECRGSTSSPAPSTTAPVRSCSRRSGRATSPPATISTCRLGQTLRALVFELGQEFRYIGCFSLIWALLFCGRRLAADPSPGCCRSAPHSTAWPSSFSACRQATSPIGT